MLHFSRCYPSYAYKHYFYKTCICFKICSVSCIGLPVGGFLVVFFSFVFSLSSSSITFCAFLPVDLVVVALFFVDDLLGGSLSSSFSIVSLTGLSFFSLLELSFLVRVFLCLSLNAFVSLKAFEFTKN